MGQLSDPYDQGEDAELDLTISGLPEDPQDPDPEGTVGPGPAASDGDADQDDLVDVQDDLVDVEDDVELDDEDDGDEDNDGDEDDGDEDDDEEEVAYDLEDFEDSQLDALFDALDETDIAYLWDGDELFVKAADEQAVDELLERVSNPDEIAADDEDSDGGGWLLGELFVVADRLQHDPEEHESIAMLLQLANAAEEADPPYGLSTEDWGLLQERVSALAEILERDKPDPDDVLEAARELRRVTRPYV